jgi:hypothetical protein
MTSELISRTYLNNLSHKSVRLYVYSLIVARQRLAKKKLYRGKEYTSKNRRIVGRVVLYAVHVVSKERRGLVLPRSSSYNSF